MKANCGSDCGSGFKTGVQKVHFAQDWKHLTVGRVRSLKTFLDPKVELLRVGGRLRNSDLPYDAKYPILLPKKSRLTILLINYVHRMHCHPGPQTTQHVLFQDFWILSVRRLLLLYANVLFANVYVNGFRVFKLSLSLWNQVWVICPDSD